MTTSGRVLFGPVSRRDSYAEYRAPKLIFKISPLSIRISYYREVETLKFALCRNIIAVVLLLALMAQTLRLFISVFNQPSLQETWDNLQTVVEETKPTLYTLL